MKQGDDNKRYVPSIKILTREKVVGCLFTSQEEDNFQLFYWDSKVIFWSYSCLNMPNKIVIFKSVCIFFNTSLTFSMKLYISIVCSW